MGLQNISVIDEMVLIQKVINEMSSQKSKSRSINDNLKVRCCEKFTKIFSHEKAFV